MLKQANEEIDELNRQLDENETIKLNQFAATERKEREIQNLKSLLRRARGFIDANRDVFGGEADELDFDGALADIDQADIEFRLPESNLRHVFRPSRHMDFISALGPLHQTTTSMNSVYHNNYYAMIEELQEQVAKVTQPAPLPALGDMSDQYLLAGLNTSQSYAQQLNASPEWGGQTGRNSIQQQLHSQSRMSEHRQGAAADNSFAIRPRAMDEQGAKQRPRWTKITGNYPSD